VHGTSTRKVDDLVRARGVDAGISKSEVSRICAELDAEVAAFGLRSLAHTAFPYLFVDATYRKARPWTSFPEATAHAVGCDAEFARLELRSDPQRWAALAAAGVLRQAHQVTSNWAKGPLRREIERLAQRARIDLRQPDAKAEGPLPRVRPQNMVSPHARSGSSNTWLRAGPTGRSPARSSSAREPPASTFQHHE
jgi:Transposase, Mutator family